MKKEKQPRDTNQLVKSIVDLSTRNRLYYGDNLEVLHKYILDETIDLCYIDPHKT